MSHVTELAIKVPFISRVHGRKWAPSLLTSLTVLFMHLGHADCNYSIVAPFVEAVPARASKLKQAADWNFDIRWTDRFQWDVGHSECFEEDFSRFFESSLHKKWDECRLTGAYLNEKLPPEKQFYKSAPCCYIKCALHWTGWVNDDYSYNEARGENMAKDAMKGISPNTLNKLMKEYRKCGKLFKFPFDSICSENVDFARCHIQAFNMMCDTQLNSREPFPQTEPEWAKHNARKKRSVPGAMANAGEKTDLESFLDTEIAARRKRHGKRPWLTTGHFCTDLCQSACSINENLYS